MRRILASLTILGGALAAQPEARAATLAPPPVPAGQPAPVAAPYPAITQAHADVAAAQAEAKRTGRDLLIDFGGNWCPDCRVLAGMLRDPAVAPWIAAHFVPVSVNVGRINTNLDLARAYGVTVKAVPTVLIVTPDGKLKDPDGTLALGDARTMSTKAVVDLLASWASR